MPTLAEALAAFALRSYAAELPDATCTHSGPLERPSAGRAR